MLKEDKEKKLYDKSWTELTDETTTAQLIKLQNCLTRELSSTSANGAARLVQRRSSTPKGKREREREREREMYDVLVLFRF